MKNQAVEKINIRQAISDWTNGKFILRSSFYTGRGVTTTDLNSQILEMIYQGIKTHVGEKEAANFVNFVANLKDLSASAFIQAFEQFWYGGCQETDMLQRERSGDQITGYGDERYIEGLAIIAGALFGQRMSTQDIERASSAISWQFLSGHEDELTKRNKEKQKKQRACSFNCF